jgi:serine/threonine-protein phosphatase 2B regulatory subunit
MNQSQEEISEKDTFIVSLASKLGISEEKAIKKHKSFILQYPRGFVTKDEFIKTSCEVLGKHCVLARHLFPIFDDDGDGKLNAEEFLFAANMSDNCSAEAKLSCIFNMLDMKNEGFIRKTEVKKVIITLFHIGCLVINQDVTDGCVNNIMETLTANGKGNVTKVEFLENAMKNSMLKNMLI